MYRFLRHPICVTAAVTRASHTAPFTAARVGTRSVWTHPNYTPEHEAFRKMVRAFVTNEIIPNIDQWEKDRRLPRSLYALHRCLRSFGCFERRFKLIGLNGS